MKSLNGAHDERKAINLVQCFVMVLAISLFTTVALADRVNINQADAETLEYIPGIGPSKAADIVEHREARGGFKSFEQLLEISGIGASTLEDIKQYGTLEGGVSVLTDEMRDNPPSKKVSASDSESGNTSG